MANMLQNASKTRGFKKNMVYKIPPGGEVNHIQPAAYYGYLEIELNATGEYMYIFSMLINQEI